MAWTTFVNSTTADADEVNDNFYHIRQGNLLPMGNASMEYTTSAYDLGSSTYTWDTLHVDTGIIDNLYMENHIYMNTSTAQIKVGSDNIAGFIEDTTSALYVTRKLAILLTGATIGSVAHGIANAMTNRNIISINPISTIAPNNPYHSSPAASNDCRFAGIQNITFSIGTAGFTAAAHVIHGISYDDTNIYVQRSGYYLNTGASFYLYVSYTK